MHVQLFSKKKKILGYVRWYRTVVCQYLILMVVIKKINEIN